MHLITSKISSTYRRFAVMYCGTVVILPHCTACIVSVYAFDDVVFCFHTDKWPLWQTLLHLKTLSIYIYSIGSASTLSLIGKRFSARHITAPRPTCFPGIFSNTLKALADVGIIRNKWSVKVDMEQFSERQAAHFDYTNPSRKRFGSTFVCSSGLRIVFSIAR